MYTLTFLIFILLALSLIIYGLASLLGKKMKKEREKNTPFECGFDPFKKARAPFSVRFFLVAIIFLIFDIEIVIILPVGLLMNYYPTPYFALIVLAIVVILTMGLVHEWNQGALDWVK
uniref:NADH-ubiquinone oxidoreductase chain 3 n=1 Tax=Metacrangonyx remyi TaxID=931576 RepID=K7ZWV2_9CRUS|nr:NADH dehydrogenase subunit 3 [Metacrangonyx remyi]CCI69565.1 NADH dehydrogenase subunit 3 [Metacrangonyx remyi]